MRAKCDYQILIILYFVDNVGDIWPMVHSPVHTQRRVAHVGEWLASWQRPPPVSPPLLSPGCPGPCVTTDGVTRPPGARTRRAAPCRPGARVNIFYKCASIETFWADQCALKINNIAPAWLWCPGLSLCPGSCLRSRSAACACAVSSPCSCSDTRSLTRMRWSRAPSSLLPLSQSQFLLKSNICRRGFHHSPASTAFLEIGEKNYVKFKFYIESK